ncbi:hypothetical protein MGYG_07496 [Nannizzia gypsea CBS 118893]|uniref:FAD/NAD(P)-binding domain-containing protein n=1 Tax=Arthroderma gypseum (strain ATCC MYA-4604 / CBS 118893) TaxID=535722 RepID=E4V3B4_ARTGP|nr:hypothetical protein MGYG_07496 [Nannizzia gypsea CBS 118893]EFR04488.1 hypothetical protein MGYG_07496 [Nannizzia gypsea CBS 118893]
MGVQRLAVALFALASVLSCVTSAPVTGSSAIESPKSEAPKTYDVIVVGGGPAGLSTLSSLGRVRRNALLFDSGYYRNGVTRHIHDIITDDGIVPSEFRKKAREQISRYDTTSIKDVKVTNITKIFEDGGKKYNFLVTDMTGMTYTARKIVLGTGVRDVIPSTPGLRENFGKGIYWCPWCDGWEHRDQPFGILGRLRSVVDSVFEVRTLHKDIIAFVNGTEHNPDDIDYLNQRYPGWRERLQRYNVKINNNLITSIDRLQDGSKVYDEKNWNEYDKFRVNFEDGESVERSVFITNFPTVQASDLPDQLGLERDEKEWNKIKVDFRGMQSSIPGVYVVGDANNDGSTNGVHAMFSGKRAAVRIHVQLEKEASEASLNKRGIEFPAKQVERDALRLIGRNLEHLEHLWDRKRKE